MAKAFNGTIKLASTISQTGAQPLDDRSVVANVSDLYNSFGSAIYNGMAVTVQATGTIFILLDKTKVGTAEGWKEVGSDIKVALTADNYTAAMRMATANNIGQIINVTAEETLEDNKYTAGLYVVTGVGAVAKLGTTSASGDLSGDVEKLKGDVSTLKDTVTKLDGKDNVDGSVKKQIKDAKDALEQEIKAAHTVVSDKADGHVKVSTAKDETTGEQTVTITEEDIASKTALDGLTTKVGNKASGDSAATGVFKYVDDKVANAPHPKYIVSYDSDKGEYSLKMDGNSIDESVAISFKDYMVRSGSVVKGSWNKDNTVFTENTEEITSGTSTAIKLVLNVKDVTGEDKSETIYIDATSLVDTYTVASGSTGYLTIDGYTISLSDTAIKNINNVPTIESGLTALTETVKTNNDNALKEIKVNEQVINSGNTAITLTGENIKTKSGIKDGEKVIVPANTAVDTVLSGIYTRIKELDGSKVTSVTAKDKSGVVVTTTDNKAEVSLDFESVTDATVADGHIEIKADEKTGKLYGVMYYNEGIPEKTTPENTTEEK